MRIVVRVHGYPPRHNAGSEWMLHSCLRALVACGHDCSVWLSRYSPDVKPYELDGVKVVPFAARMDFASAAAHADAIVSYWENVPPAGALARGFGRPFVVLAHNASPMVLRNIGAATTALVVYNSEYVAAEAEQHYATYPKAVRPGNAIVVRPPVFADEYATTPGDRVTLINLCPEKGGDLFWRLAKRMPGTKFLGVRGAYGEQIVEDLPNVEVVDHLPGDRMRDEVYARTRVLLMPSLHESWGRTGIEAMCSGIPVVAHPTPGLCESLGEAGIFADRGDADGWVSVLERLSDDTEWSQASERATRRAKELDPTGDLATWCEAIESLRG
jgi:glycosyltransferase involved in cell wall biosynthesis